MISRRAVSEYTERYPEDAEENADLFPAMLMMENLKPAADDEFPSAKDTVLPFEQPGDVSHFPPFLYWNSGTQQIAVKGSGAIVLYDRTLGSLRSKSRRILTHICGPWRSAQRGRNS